MKSWWRRVLAIDKIHAEVRGAIDVWESTKKNQSSSIVDIHGISAGHNSGNTAAVPAATGSASLAAKAGSWGIRNGLLSSGRLELSS